ncbi:MAG: lytic murein transglycosylase [Marinovum sp.]|jgi:lytic murein transglycosylase|nr:lytic murein transglycosylase [Marinovum sp.]
MYRLVFSALALISTLGISSIAAAQNCGGGFYGFVQDLKSEARARGYSSALSEQFFASVAQDPKVIKADRAQGVFQLPFLEFSGRLISDHRLQHGAKNAAKYKREFDYIERELGVPRGVLLAFWAFETDYGAFQGNFNTLNALVTLAHDCRRPELFRPQIFAALELFKRGDFDPVTTTGAWAGEIGMVQMLPEDILVNGIDGDGDGQVQLKTSAPDALMSGASMLRALGWQPNQPWLQQVTLPADMDWSLSGLTTEKSLREWAALGLRGRHKPLASDNLMASVLLPQGHKGPAFLVYPNFRVFIEWNESLIYITTAGYFATLLEGGAPLDPVSPDTGLTGDQMRVLQQKLVELGFDVGDVDGILGAKTRAAVRIVQDVLAMPIDGWPTPALLNSF